MSGAATSASWSTSVLLSVLIILAAVSLAFLYEPWRIWLSDRFHIYWLAPTHLIGAAVILLATAALLGVSYAQERELAQSIVDLRNDLATVTARQDAQLEGNPVAPTRVDAGTSIQPTIEPANPIVPTIANTPVETEIPTPTLEPTVTSIPTATYEPTPTETPIPTDTPVPPDTPTPQPAGKGGIIKGEGISVQLVDYEVRASNSTEKEAIQYTLGFINETNEPVELRFSLADITGNDDAGITYADSIAIAARWFDANGRYGCISVQQPSYPIDQQIVIPANSTHTIGLALNRVDAQGDCQSWGLGASRVDFATNYVDLKIKTISYRTDQLRQITNALWRLTR